ncbi:unnamed protein product, partial [Musa hybrid cultivar]
CGRLGQPRDGPFHPHWCLPVASPTPTTLSPPLSNLFSVASPMQSTSCLFPQLPAEDFTARYQDRRQRVPHRDVEPPPPPVPPREPCAARRASRRSLLPQRHPGRHRARRRFLRLLHLLLHVSFPSLPPPPARRFLPGRVPRPAGAGPAARVRLGAREGPHGADSGPGKPRLRHLPSHRRTLPRGRGGSGEQLRGVGARRHKSSQRRQLSSSGLPGGTADPRWFQRFRRGPRVPAVAGRATRVV